jgi:hypothetical protein
MWLRVGESVEGTSHIDASLPCQDACSHGVLGHGAEEIALFAVSDGAGSAPLSHIGSQCVCRSFIEYCSVNQLRLGSSLDRAFSDELFDHLLDKLHAEAAARCVEPAALACTFLAAIVGLDWAHFIQIGDGAIVVDDDQGYGCVFWPMSGEYANVTTFLTSPGAATALMTTTQLRRVRQLAALTDGLQLLALDFLSKKAHGPFFAPMFAYMEKCSDGSEVTVSLREFLNSAPVNAKTDDDKTLVLGIRKE